MFSPKSVVVLALVTLPAAGATVTIESVMTRIGVTNSPASVPGRPAPFVFRGDNPIPPPAINDAGEIVFRARSAASFDTNNGTAFGLYAKQPSFPLAVLVDTTEVSPGVPTFAVPGRPANNRFVSFRPPLLNNAGDVVFQASFTSPGTTPSSGSGIYATKVTGGPIIQLVDTFTPVPSHPTGLFNTFDPNLLSVALTTTLNEFGQVAYWGQFLITGNATQRTGLFGTSVAGGAGVRLADSVGASGPVSVPVGANGFFNEIRYAVALNNPGTVVFSAGMPGGATNRGGVYVVAVTGGPIETVAIRSQPVPNRPGQTFQDTFEPGGHNVDINDSGVVLFRNQYQLSSPFDSGAYSAVPVAGVWVHTRIYDTGPGLTIPGEPAGAEFSGFVLPSVNEANVVAPFSRVFPGSPTPNQQGIYYTDTDGTPMSVVANLNTAPPGQPPPVGGFPRFTAFDQTNGALGALNETGNLTFIGTGNPTSGTGFRGLYFYDVCTPELVRISDSTMSTGQLGEAVNNAYDIWQVESHAGMYRSINNSDDVAFTAQFSNLDYGIFIAHIDLGGGGQLAVTCPPDVSGECPVDGSVAGNGTATATGCGTIVVSSSDAVASGCGGTETITRTWTADNGSTTATCTQTITEADTTGPVLSGVPDKTSVECGTSPPPAAEVTAMDACQGSVPVSLAETSSPGPCPGAYMLTRTWTAIDGCGNATEASHTVCVIDTTDPTLMGVPGDVSVECDAVPPAAMPTTSDTCDTMPTISLSETRTDGTCPFEYSLSRTWTATDDCDNDVAATQVVTVDDTVAPTIACPAHTAQECPGDTGVAANGMATGSDNCGSTAISSSDVSQTGCGATQTVTRTWTASDECGNSSTCDQTVAVVDTMPPVFTGVPADAAVECDAVPAAASPTAADACDPDTPVSSAETRVDGACASSYTLTRTWSAADDCSNSATVSQTVSVNDTTPPVVSCPANATLECPGDTSVGVNGSATASDNCSPATVAFADATTPGCGNTFTVTRTWTATDACALAGSCNQSIATVDTTPPVLSVSTTPIVVTDADCSGSECVALPTGTAADACDASVSVAHDAPACGPSDDPAPDDDDDDADHDDDDDFDHDDDDDGHHDGDDDDDDTPTGTCNGFCLSVGETTVTYSATDACGNTATATLPVTVRQGANIAVRAETHTVHHGHHPYTDKDPLVGIVACAYDRSYGACAKTVCGGTSHSHYQCILDQCDPVGCCTTAANGRCTINISPGDYLVLADDETEEVLPDPLGATISDLDCGETKTAYLKQIIDVRGKKKPCKTTRLTGSELLIIEPEFIVWDEEEQLYPFVFETIGDWSVTATVAPPEGFVADYEALSADVDNELESVQFTITEVGSDLVPTQTSFQVVHNGTRQTVRSDVDIRLTPDYAVKRGFNVRELRTRGLIVEPVQVARPIKNSRQPTGR